MKRLRASRTSGLLRRPLSRVVLGWAVSSNAGCHGGTAAHPLAEPPSTAPPRANAGVPLGSPSNDEAVMRIATARCELELACDSIGRGRTFEDYPTCMEIVGRELQMRVGVEPCPDGVESEAVTRCTADIRATTCAAGPEQRSRIPSCEPSRICSRATGNQARSTTARSPHPGGRARKRPRLSAFTPGSGSRLRAGIATTAPQARAAPGHLVVDRVSDILVWQ